jgi:hypothetical protein
MTTQPKVTLEVLALGEGHAVARVAGNKMPVLVLCPTAIAELRRLFEAAATRARALPDSKIADAVAEFVRTFEGVVSQYDAEAKSFGSDIVNITDRDAAARQFELELKALNQLGEPSNHNDST